MRAPLALAALLMTLGCTPKPDPAAPPPEPAAAAAPASAAATYSGDRAGAEQLLRAFLAPGADRIALSKALQPRPGDYAKVFTPEAAAQAAAGYAAPWEAGAIVIGPKPDQTELQLASATSEELRSGAEPAKEFPGGYARIKDQLQPGLTWYRFKFVEPGATAGMAFDGLVHVDGRWALFPKPWRVIKAPATP